MAKRTKAKVFSFLPASNNISDLFIKRIPLQGKHNLNNVLAALSVAKVLKIPFKTVEVAVKNFKPLEYRLEKVGERQGVSFYCDSLATIPEATIAAIDSFQDKNLVLILGGADRGQNFRSLAQKLKYAPNVLGVVLIGETAERIKSSLDTVQFKGKVVELGKSSMNKIIKESISMTTEGSIILLSPAAASFDMFKDYKERGNEFRKVVDSLEMNNLIKHRVLE